MIEIVGTTRTRLSAEDLKSVLINFVESSVGKRVKTISWSLRNKLDSDGDSYTYFDGVEISFQDEILCGKECAE